VQIGVIRSKVSLREKLIVVGLVGRADVAALDFAA